MGARTYSFPFWNGAPTVKRKFRQLNRRTENDELSAQSRGGSVELQRPLWICE
jgi:hypothetical protein